MYANVNSLRCFQQGNQFIHFFLRTFPFGVKFTLDTLSMSRNEAIAEILFYELLNRNKVFFVLCLCEEIVCCVICHNLNILSFFLPSGSIRYFRA